MEPQDLVRYDAETGKREILLSEPRGILKPVMGVASAINDLLRSVSQKQRVRLSHYQEFLEPAAMPADLDEAVRRALAAGEIRLLESVPLEVAGNLRNFHFSLPRGESPGPLEE